MGNNLDIKRFDADFLLKVQLGLVQGYSIIDKFGENPNVTTTLTPICSSGFYRTPTTPVALEVLSSDGRDTSGGIGLNSLTVVGLDVNGDRIIQNISLNGTTPVALPTDIMRNNRMFGTSSGSYASQTTPSQFGTITLREVSTGNTWGVINKDGSFGLGQSLIGATTIPKGYKAVLIENNVSVDSNKTASVYFFKREFSLSPSAPYGVMRLQNLLTGLTGFNSISSNVGQVYDELTDIGYMGKVSTGTADISVNFKLLLIDKNYL